MNDKRSLKKSKTIFRKTFEPVLAILLFLLGIYTVVIHEQVLTYLKISAFDVLREQTVNCRDAMQGRMVARWSAIDTNVEQITQQIQDLVSDQGKSMDHIKTDASLNQTIIESVTEDLIELLKTGDTTEVFLILNGMGIDGEEDSRGGVYIRNSSPEIYSESNSSLLYERGLPSISKLFQISLDSFWDSAFYLNESDDYFYKPLMEAMKSDNKDYKNFGYWSYGRPIAESDKNILTYSVPLIAEDGTVFGVMGIGIDESHVIKNIQNPSQKNTATRAYMLVRMSDDGTFTPVLMKGKAYSKANFVGRTFHMNEVRDIFFIDYPGTENNRICTDYQTLKLYNSNTPFENDVWAILSIQKENELLSTYQMAQKLLALLVFIGVVVCSACIFWFSRLVSRPIQVLIKELRQSDPNSPIRLSRVHVVEIDALSDSIMELSSKVAATYSKITTILQMTDVGMAVFEYKEGDNTLFCNKSLYHMLGWSELDTKGGYIDGTFFKERAGDWLLGSEESKDQVIEVRNKDGEKRWVRLVQIHDKNAVLGVLTDVTTEVLEKLRIEHERDYDSLTDLLNRRAFEDIIGEVLKDEECVKNAVLMVWDLDNLKYINDTYGHFTGDDYITAFAEKLRDMNCSNIFSARRSGDEFVTFLYGYEDEESLLHQTEAIWASVSRAEIILPNQHRYKVRVSMGKAWYPRDARDYKSMFEYADFAMYMVKHSRKGTMADFDEFAYQENRILLKGQEAFNSMIENRLVKYMLQPIISSVDGSTYGYEMLMRSDVDIFRSPMDILRMAHSQSRLYEIEVMTWFEAMKCFVSKVEEGACPKDKKVFINSISNQILGDKMVQLFEQTFKDYLQNIVCEFTEEEEGNSDFMQKKLGVMRRWGCMTAIDDYGCGYNSESVLLRLSPDIVKIDIDIIRGVDSDKDRQQLVTNLVHYAHQRDILVLAEGVETEAEMKTAILLGVDLLQGYYLSRPAYEIGFASDEVKAQICSIRYDMKA